MRSASPGVSVKLHHVVATGYPRLQISRLGAQRAGADDGHLAFAGTEPVAFIDAIVLVAVKSQRDARVDKQLEKLTVQVVVVERPTTHAVMPARGQKPAGAVRTAHLVARRRQGSRVESAGSLQRIIEVATIQGVNGETESGLDENGEVMYRRKYSRWADLV